MGFKVAEYHYTVGTATTVSMSTLWLLQWAARM